MVTPQKFKSRKRVTSNITDVGDVDEDFQHLNSNIFKPKEIDLNRKTHSSPSKSLRHASDLIDDKSQVIIFLLLLSLVKIIV